MNKIFLKLHGTTSQAVKKGGILVLTAKQFLGKEEGISYYQPESFVEFANSLREPEVEQLEQVCDCMKDGLRTAGGIVTRIDKGGRPYTYLNFIKLNSTVGLKYIMEGGMKQFIKDYQNGKFIIGFTLDELVEEAMND